MKFLRTLFMNEPEDCAEIAQMNLSGHDNVPAFASFVVHGQVDAPAQLDLYKSQKPEYNERPVAVFVRSGAGMVPQ